MGFRIFLDFWEGLQHEGFKHLFVNYLDVGKLGNWLEVFYDWVQEVGEEKSYGYDRINYNCEDFKNHKSSGATVG